MVISKAKEKGLDSILPSHLPRNNNYVENIDFQCIPRTVRGWISVVWVTWIKIIWLEEAGGKHLQTKIWHSWNLFLLVISCFMSVEGRRVLTSKALFQIVSAVGICPPSSLCKFINQKWIPASETFCPHIPFRVVDRGQTTNSMKVNRAKDVKENTNKKIP